jgi:hypothetical protein
LLTSRAFSAFVSVITPTAAFAAKISNMTYSNQQKNRMSLMLPVLISSFSYLNLLPAPQSRMDNTHPCNWAVMTLELDQQSVLAENNSVKNMAPRAIRKEYLWT